ncbi:MAG: tRNA (adenosine(37)-N6)-threonylcarbamoyltransferase complex dimerization subunit type 1 TsaB [Crocinitomicaceae bacterium]|jgi:tRNA threonylcarbamoyladenosine biosynthesis protein TsaB|nr:tRNA (adenosine(37)-N6)-threonylcarbamoyltransferase complex dimerization subunit type 1 TsaB [Crocinitomicaceae bacterium]|tara:strand:- start:1649 stop:2401 length:753 start_codon:yes stop_codon:yes gene_type:complete
MVVQPLILAIETSTLSCSVALFRGDALLGEAKAAESNYVHGKRLLPMIDELLQSNGIASFELKGIAVSSGPGSYTGLRIGVSTAKGIAHAHGLPLMAFDSLQVQAYAAESQKNWETIISVMDARRDEVYTASFVQRNNKLAFADPTRALILEPQRHLTELFPVLSPFEDFSGVLILGDAAEKTQRLIGDRMSNCSFTADFPHAKHMHQLALSAFAENDFVDLAYFEPRYLKEFQAGTPRDPLGLRKQTIR